MADLQTGRPRAGAGVRSWLRTHRVFLLALVLGGGLRAVVMFGFPPAMWFNDSYEYVAVALYPHPNLLRPSGYALVLRSLLPFHSFALVAALQHVAGLVLATLCYGLPRRFGLPGWAATLVAAPVLFDAYQLQLEQTVMSDTLFLLLVTAAMVLVCRHPRPLPSAGAGAAALLGLAAITRTVGLPLLALLMAYLLLRRVGWRAFAAALAAGALPVVSYAAWFHSAYGRYALTGTDGVFLYSRTMAFADCDAMRPPAQLRALCAVAPPRSRPPSQMYMWDRRAPLRAMGHPASSWVNERAGRFARLAIRRQPGDYLRVVTRDTARAFQWKRTPFPNPQTYALYQFNRVSESPPRWAPRYLDRYDPAWTLTRMVDPYGRFLGWYQRHVYLPGSLLGVILLTGAAGVASRFSRGPIGGYGLLPLAVSVTLIVVPAATAEFGYRYVLVAVPAACLAAGLAVGAPRWGEDTVTHPWDRIPRRRQIP